MDFYIKLQGGRILCFVLKSRVKSFDALDVLKTSLKLSWICLVLALVGSLITTHCDDQSQSGPLQENILYVTRFQF